MPTDFHKNTRYYFTGKILNVVLAPVAVLVLPGWLGDHAYARYGYWFSLISIYIVFLDLGTQAMLRRYLPEFAATSPESLRPLWRFNLLLKFIPISLLLLTLFFSAQPAVQFWLFCAALCAALSTSFADLYYGFQQMGPQAWILLGRKLLRLILVPVFFYFWLLPGILAALVLAELVPMLFGLRATRLLPDPKSSAESIPLRKIYVVGLAGFTGFLCATVLGRAPILFSEWSHYDAAVVGRIALAVDLTYFALKELINGISESIVPQLIRYQSLKQYDEARALIGMNYRYVNFTALLFIAVGVPLVPCILPLLGSSYYLASTEVQLLTIAALFGCWNTIHNQILFIHNKIHNTMWAQVYGLLFMATLMMIFFWPTRSHTNAHPVSILSASLTASLVLISAISYAYTRTLQGSSNTTAYFLKLFPAALITALLLLWWRPQGIIANLAAMIAGSALYCLLGLVCGGLAKADYRHLYKIIGSR